MAHSAHSMQRNYFLLVCNKICNKSQSINWSYCKLTALGAHVLQMFSGCQEPALSSPLSCFDSVRVSGQCKTRIKQNNQAMYFHEGKQITVGKF